MADDAIDSIMKQLGQATKKVSGKKRNTKPEVDCPEIDNKIDDWIQAHRDLKTAEAAIAASEMVILPKADELRREQCTNRHSFESSIRINGKVQVISACRYSAIPIEEYDSLKKAFGDKSTDFFKPKVTLKLTEEALGDERVIARIIKAFGSDFGNYFEVKRHLEVTEDFHKERIMSPEVRDVADKLIDGGIIRPSKMSIKPIS